MLPKRSIVLASAMLALGTSALISAQSSSKLNEDLPTGTMREKATTACLECHDARIIVQQRLSKAAWTKEVDKMIKWGAVVDANGHDALVDYFSANFGTDQPAYNAPRTAAEKSAAKSNAKR